MLRETGIPSAQDLEAVTPPAERLVQGPVAVIECFQRIPCDPCYLACKQRAIQAFAEINDLPRIDYTKCNGCAICAANCPGLAIFVLDLSYGQEEALLKIPYEFLPLPAEKSAVLALDREGQVLGKARVDRVQRIKGQERTPVVWLAVPKNLAMSVRNIKVEGKE